MSSGAFAARLDRVLEAISAAAGRVGRAPESVRIVAITKGHPAPVLIEALDGGLRDIGENRVAEAREKFGEVDRALSRSGARRHMVGHLQRNKVRDAAALFDWIQSVDSLRLARALSGRAADRAEPIRILIEVNGGGEEQKHGFAPGMAVEGALEMVDLPGLSLRGVMTMAPWTGDESVLRRAFQTGRTVFEALRAAAPAGSVIDTLSMGMTNDYALAIEEGATMIRIGTALFGEAGR